MKTALFHYLGFNTIFLRNPLWFPMTPSSLRVAIADDDCAMREVLQALLRNLGHQVVVVAENGQSLITQCAIMRPDVIITDNFMPDISGAEAAAIIYEQRATQIILLSAFCDRELVMDAEQKHVLMYLVKPVSVDHLEAALNQCQEVRKALECDATEEELDFQTASRGSSGTTLYPRIATPPYTQARRPR